MRFRSVLAVLLVFVWFSMPVFSYYCGTGAGRNCGTRDCSLDCSSNEGCEDSFSGFYCSVDTTQGGDCFGNLGYGVFVILEGTSNSQKCDETSLGTSVTFGDYTYYCSDFSGIYLWKTCHTDSDEGKNNFFEAEHACSNGNYKLCNDDIKCESFSVNSEIRYCYSNEWKTASDVKESCEDACSAVGGSWTGSTCCDGSDAFFFDSYKQRCESESIHVCGSDTYCSVMGGRTCIKDESNIDVWSQNECSSNGACIEGTWKAEGCSYLDGWYGGGDSGEFDDPVAEHRTYSCSSGSCAYTITETIDCDVDGGESLGGDGWYGGGNIEGCGEDYPIELRDYYFDTSTSTCKFIISQKILSGDETHCDANDECGSICQGYVAAGGIDYYYQTFSGKDSLPTTPCDKFQQSSVDCLALPSTDSDSSETNYYFVPGYVTDYDGCSEGTCTSSVIGDSCSGDILEEKYVPASPGTGYSTEQKSCNDYDDCSEDLSRQSNIYYLRDYTCKLNQDNGYCDFDEADLDTKTSYCNTCLGDGHLVGAICCGDDAQEFVVESSIDETKACCKQNDDCVFEGICYDNLETIQVSGVTYECRSGVWSALCAGEGISCNPSCCSGFSCTYSTDGSTSACCPSPKCWDGTSCVSESTKVSNDRYLCNASQWADASAGNCQRIPLTYTYYSLSGAWVYATQANATCPDACTDLGGAWKDGKVISGFRCCVSDSKESLLQLAGDQSLCDDFSWINASSPGPDPRAVYSRYISDGSEWHKCTTEGDEISVGGVDYVCESGAWQNMVCEGQGDEFKTTCKTCNGTWLGLGRSKNCCGNNVMDEFLISGSGDAQLCFGSQGVLECTSTTTCDAVSFSDGTTYYCFGNKWSKNSNFGGSVYKEYGGTGGCCGAGQCWDGTACVDEGSYGDRLCVGGSWIACNESTLCSSLTASFGTYYCTDTGWDESEELLCGIQTGICQDGACRKCGTDFGVGDVVEGYLCSSAGIFTTGCMSDLDCTAGTECQKGTCSNGQCVYESLPCGATCSAGICDGAGACSPKLGAGAGCACNELCDEGLFCGEGLCRMSDTCGDGVCQAGECSACPQDCTLEQCLDDGTCNTLIGENCRNSADCSCYSASCDPGNPKADSRGCFANICGNGVCEPGECSNCVSDCTKEDCRGNGECDLIMGETCADNPDECFCNLSVADVSYVDMEIGQYGTVTLTLENTGNVPMVVDLDLVAPGIETVLMGSRHKQINPGDTKDIEIKAKALSKGSYSINVFATGSQVQDLNVGEVAIQVASSNFLADMYNAFKGTKLYSTIFEPFEFIFGVAGILGTMFGVWRYVASKVSNPSPYVGYRRPYTGSNYYRGYYYRQGGQFRGYYRQFR